ncbi:hypothetical protein C8Q77DRAFT_1146073 [Trametes polyzona]|nr:hypothetical protein C8Q77DRAFT_1146073 [Trametes polyzona]
MLDSNLTLKELKALLSASTELNGSAHEPRTYDPDDFSVVRSIRLIERQGLPMIVKYGTGVSCVEAETTIFVARHTTVRVPAIYAIFIDTEMPPPPPPSAGRNTHAVLRRREMTYIVEERLPGRTLREAWPFLTPSEREVVVSDLQNIFTQLSELVPGLHCLGPLRGGWQNAYFRLFAHYVPCGELDARTPEDFFVYFIRAAYPDLPSGDKRNWAVRMEHIDVSRRAVFSHGDLQPCNVLVDTGGHVTGVFGWSAAGWYPYFWDTFVLQGSVTRLGARLHGWGDVVPRLCPWYLEEAREFAEVWTAAVETATASDTSLTETSETP